MFFPIKKYRVIGKSMEPTLKDGDTVLACYVAYKLSKPKIGHTVIVSHPTKRIPIIKRVARVKNGKYFLEGDNTHESSGSRDFGWLDREKIQGKVFYTLRA